MFRLALCGKNYELLEKIESHIQSFVETYKNETKCISIEQYKQLASLRDDMVDGIHFDILMVEIDAHPHEDFRLLSEIRKTATDTIVILFSKFLDYDFTRLGYQICRKQFALHWKFPLKSKKDTTRFLIIRKLSEFH